MAFPKVGDIVNVSLIKNDVIGIKVSLNDYNNIEAFIPMTEMHFPKRISFLREGKTYKAVILEMKPSILTRIKVSTRRVDQETGIQIF